MDYQEFLKQKQKQHIESGFDIPESELNPNLFDFQKFIVKRSLKAGKYGIFADCGLGKTFMQLEYAYQVFKYTGKSVLIICPLAVAGQTIQEGKRFGYDVNKMTDYKEPGIYIVNYENIDKYSFSDFSGVILDESSILKNFEGAIKKNIIDTFRHTPYKLACTASPSPNDPMELGNHADFLDVMSRNEMLAMYFVHDGGETSKWRLKGHAVKSFYQFISTWAVMLCKPSDIGFKDKGYDLPNLNYIEKMIITEKRDNGLLFNDTAINATNFNQELRLTKLERLEQVADIVNNSNENFIIWIKQNEEGELLRKLIPDSIEVKGNDDIDYKEKMLLGFANNEFRVLITKTKIAQFGLNYQNCNNQVFASLDFSFEGLYQAIRRSYRFGQKNEVNIYLITTDTMSNVIKSLETKQRSFETMQKEMANAMNENLNNNLLESKYFDIKEFKTDEFTIKNGDSFELIKDIDTESLDGSIFSPPFSSLYTYSDSVNDLSNCLTHDVFYKHFEFMIPELLRTLKSGRMIGIHLTQLTTGIAKDGYFSVIDFRGEIIRLFQKHGFIFHGEVTIWKSPELAAIRTKNHQLLHKSTKRDSLICRPGLADYLVIFRKPGVNQKPVNHNGDGIPFEKWCKIASPVWYDIQESDTLQFRGGRNENDEKHITPTQLSVIENFLTLYTNPGDIVFTPFLGIGSEVYQAIKMNRKAIGFELKESYFQQAVKNLELLIKEKKQMSLF